MKTNNKKYLKGTIFFVGMLLSLFVYTYSYCEEITQISTGDGATNIYTPQIICYIEKQEQNLPTIQYMRAFGAFKVPLLMKYILAKQNTNVIAAPQFEKFWEKRWSIIYPIENELWNNLEEENFFGNALYSKIIAPNYNSVIKFYLSSIYNSDDKDKIEKEKEAIAYFERKFSITIPSHWESLPGPNESEVGFLFFILENNTEKPFYDITIEYKSIKSLLKKNDQLMLAFYNSMPDIDWDEPGALALHDRNIETADWETSVKKIALLRPGEAAIWLLSIYKSQNNGMPEYYLENVEIPLTINLYSAGKEISQKVRPPYGLSAARIPLPKDWLSMKSWMGQ